MKIGLYGKSSNTALRAIHDGAMQLGFDAAFCKREGFSVEGFGLVVLIGMHEKSRTVRDAYQAIGTPVLILDSGYILRDHGYFQAGWNGLNALPPTAPHDRAAEMGLIAQTKRKPVPDGHILICGQKPGDAQHDIDVDAWKDATIDMLQEYTDRPHCYRPHPRVKKPDFSLSEILQGCHCMVTYNSTAAYEAIMAGVPVICDPCAAYADVCEVDLSRVETPRFGTKAARQRLLDRVAYGQWTMDEMRSGAALQFLLEHAGCS